MTDQSEQQKEKKKGFFGRLMDKLDNKMKEAAEKKPCCCSSDKDRDSSCS